MTAPPPLKTARRRLLTNAAAGAAQALVSGVVLFALYRILLSRLGADTIGSWSLLMAWLSLGRVADLGLPGGMVRFAAASFAAGDSAEGVSLLRRGMLATGLLTAAATASVALIIGRLEPEFLAHAGPPTHVLAWAATAAWLNCVAVAVRAGLDALQRVDLRHGTLIAQNILFLCGVFVLVEGDGLGGLLVAQGLAVGATIVIASAALLNELRVRRQLVALPLSSRSTVRLRRLLAYGLPFQITTVAALVLDPLVKLLLGRFAGLASVTWYEMASKLVTQVRSVVVNAMEALVPHVAALGDTQRRASLDEDYRRAFEVNLGLSSLGLGLLIANLPVVGWLWVGHHEPTFLVFAAILAFSWWFNSLSVPAFFVAQGLGVQRWNVLSQVIMAIATGTLGLLLGAPYGGVGVLVAFALAMIFSTLFILVGLHRELDTITQRDRALALPLGYLPLLAIVAVPIACASPDSSMVESLGASAVASLLSVGTVWYAGSNRDLIRQARQARQ